jgi:outer membrane protein W
MMGYKIGTLRIQAGPYAFKQLNEAVQKDQGAFDLTLNKDNLNWGLQAGLGLNIAKRWQLDVRYMRSMQKLNYKAVVDNKSEFFDGNMNTLYLSFGFSLIKV